MPSQARGIPGLYSINKTKPYDDVIHCDGEAVFAIREPDGRLPHLMVNIFRDSSVPSDRVIELDVDVDTDHGRRFYRASVRINGDPGGYRHIIRRGLLNGRAVPEDTEEFRTIGRHMASLVRHPVMGSFDMRGMTSHESIVCAFGRFSRS